LPRSFSRASMVRLKMPLNRDMLPKLAKRPLASIASPPPRQCLGPVQPGLFLRARPGRAAKGRPRGRSLPSPGG
jgi:hypothetical protein